MFCKYLNGKCQFRQTLNKPNMLRKSSAILFLVGCPGFVFCSLTHICMAGHMQHPPYPTWHLISDYIWLISYILAGVLAFRSNINFRKIFSILVLLLCLSRSLGSGGGGLQIVELPILIFLIINSIRGLRRAAFEKTQASENELSQHKKIIRRRWTIAGICFIACIILCLMTWVIFDIVRVSRVPLTTVSESSIPFSQEFNVNEGEAIWVELPNGKRIAFWGYFFHPDCGERPFKSPRRIWTKVSSVKKTSDRVKSYIQTGHDTIRSTDEEKKYSWFVNNYCIALECEREGSNSYNLLLTVRYAQQEELTYLKERFGSWPLFE